MKIYGQLVDDETRCVHYQGKKDIIALQCAQCLRFYPCYRCHNAAEDHLFAQWKSTQFSHHAIYCGHCHTTLSIKQYLQVEACPNCGAKFNPNCSKHYDLYFSLENAQRKTAL